MEKLMLFNLPAEKGRWILVCLGLLINLCLGSIYSWSVFVKPLTDYFINTLGRSVTAGEILMPFSVFLACFSIAMLFAGKYVEEWGPRNATIVGGVLTGTGWMLASVVTSVEMLYLVYGVIGGIGVGIAYGVPVAVAARWFPDRRGLAVGLTVLGFGFSAFLTANIADLLIGGFGVMNTFRIFGVAFLILIVLFALPLRFPPADWKPAGFTPPSGSEDEYCEYTRDRMLKTKTFYGLWICYFIGCTAGLMAISIAKPVGSEVAGVAPALGTLLIGFFAIFNGGGRPIFGFVTDRLNPSNTAVVSFLLIAAASFAIWVYPSVPVYIVSFAILWGCLGGWLAIAPAATGRYFGTCDYPRCYGVVFLAYGAGAMAGPQIAGFIRTTTGGYTGVFPYVTVLAMIGIAVAWVFMKVPKKTVNAE
ncbi:MAG: OFA family MFS transporter [Methanomicrobiaceae archaeon]|nr:OFA family MFS transporter [Methanomicrobiaceae archaeon]